MSTLFDFNRPSNPIAAATKASAIRRSGTVAETSKHSMIGTQSPDATIHHLVMAAMPHPIRARADEGDHYMVAYVSVPVSWVPRITTAVAKTWNVSFLGPAGFIQRLPPTLHDMEDILGTRIYVGFDWFVYTMTDPATQQPAYAAIKNRCQAFIEMLKGAQ